MLKKRESSPDIESILFQSECIFRCAKLMFLGYSKCCFFFASFVISFGFWLLEIQSSDMPVDIADIRFQK